MKFIIIGAGLSGLSCGVALAMHGHDVVMVEREMEAGGLARCFRADGYTFDYGPHYLFGPKVPALLKEILAPELELTNVKRTQERMYFKGKYFRFPFEPKNLLLSMESMETAGALFDLCLKRLARKVRPRPARNVEEWVIQSVGRRIYDYTSLGGYIEKLYGILPSEISEDWGLQKLKFLSRLRDANLMELGCKAFREKKNLEAQVVSYPAGGIDQLAAHIRNRFVQLGGEILFGSEVVGVEEKGDTASLTFQKQGKHRCLEGDFLISTIPVTALLNSIEPSPPKEIVRSASDLKYRSLLLLFLCIGKEKVMDYQCIYFTENDRSFRRITEFKNLDRRMTPEGKTSLCIEITCFEGDQICQMGKEDVFKMVTDELERDGYLKTQDIEDYHLLKIPFAYPVYDIPYSNVLQSIIRYLKGLRNVVSIGRQGLFFYNAMNSSILMSYELGNRLAASNRDSYREVVGETYRERLGKYATH